MQELWVQSLVGELRSHMLPSAAERLKNKIAIPIKKNSLKKNAPIAPTVREIERF